MLIELKDINKGFQIGHTYLPVLTDVNLTLNPGDRVHVRGRNGAGKTTLLRIISGELNPDSGEVIRTCPKHEIALLSQAIPTYVGKNLTVAEHISLGLVNCSTNPFKRAVSSYNIERCRDFLSEFAIGLEKRLSDIVGNLSGGELQLVGLATILALKPKVLCLDEPSAALDYRVSSIVAEMLNNFSVDNALVFVAHNDNFAEHVRNSIMDI